MGPGESFFSRHSFAIMVSVLGLCVFSMVLILLLSGKKTENSADPGNPAAAVSEVSGKPEPGTAGSDPEPGESRKTALLCTVIRKYMDNGKFDLAQQFLTESLARFPQNRDLKEVQEEFNLRYEKNLQTESRFRVYCDSAQRAAENSQWSLAAVNYENAIRIHPEPELKTALKNSRVNMKLKEADRLIEKELYQDAYRALSEALEIENRPETAQKLKSVSLQLTMEKQAEVREQNFNRQKNRAEELLEQKKYREALESFNLARQYVGSGDQARYIETRTAICSKRISEIEISDAFTQFLEQGETEYGKGHLTRALQEYKKASELKPDNMEVKDLIRKTADELKSGKITDGAGVEMILIPGSEFLRGSAEEQDAVPVREIYISSFYMDLREVTNIQYEKFDPFHKRSAFSADDDMPVTNLTWGQAAAYCRWRGEKSNAEYRLPTEAEWEKAAKGGKNLTYSWGPEYTPDKGNTGLQRKTATPSGTYPASSLGLYDLSGNVWEWCYDWYGKAFYKDSPSSNPLGPAAGDMKVVRGGSFRFGRESCRTFARNAEKPDSPGGDIGFRTVRMMGKGQEGK